MPVCPICGKDLAYPDSPGHINSKFHQDALAKLESEKAAPKAAPKKEEPKPEPKKEEPKPAPKAAPKAQPKKEEPKPAPKAEPKKEKPPKEKKEKAGKSSFKDRLVNISKRLR